MAAYIPITSGELDQPVTLRTMGESLDANRSPVRVDNSVGDTEHWARIRYLSGSELKDRGQTVADASTEIVMRKFTETAAMRTKDRISSSTDTYEIVSIQNPHERGEYLIFMCSKVEAQS